MGPIEYLWLILTMFFAVVGVIRGFLKELGVTIVLVATLFALDRLIPLTEQLIRDGKLQFLGLRATAPTQFEAGTNLLLMIVFQLILLAAVFIAYQGETLAFEGTGPKGFLGVMLGLMIGMANGYLVTGTLWWLLNHYNYPVSHAIVDPTKMTELAKSFINNGLLPLDLLGGGTTSVDSFGLLAVILVILIILKVIR